MIMVEFDPIARELVLQFEDGRMPLSFPTDHVIVKHHGQEGQLFAELREPDQVCVGAFPIPDNPVCALLVEPVGMREWRVTLLPST